MQASVSQSPYVFVVGCARSGTTLLQPIVDAHPLIAISPEIHWITRSFKEGNELALEGLVTPELVSSLVAHKRFPQLDVSREELAKLVGHGRPVPYPRFLTGLFDLYGKAKGKPRG